MRFSHSNLFSRKNILNLSITISLSVSQIHAAPSPVSGNNLSDCVNKLSGETGGWCEIRVSKKHPSISSVWPKLDKKTHMRTGPQSVLIAWNGAAFDEQQRVLYFTGGGHADYGGNEVYTFSLDDGKWERLTNPSPLNKLYKWGAINGINRYCWAPDTTRVPAAGHTYDGIHFSKKTGTIFVIINAAANGACFDDTEGKINEKLPYVIRDDQPTNGIYEFNPSKSLTLQQLKPLTWRRLQSLPKFPNPRIVELPNQNMLIGARNSLFPFDPLTKEIGKKLFLEADHGAGLAKYYPPDTLLLISKYILRVINLTTKASTTYKMPKIHGKSLAINNDGVIVSWDGKNQIQTLNLKETTPKWHITNWGDAGPQLGDHRVYSKWQYIKRDDVFVGISSDKTGVWIYKHPN